MRNIRSKAISAVRPSTIMTPGEISDIIAHTKAVLTEEHVAQRCFNLVTRYQNTVPSVYHHEDLVISCDSDGVLAVTERDRAVLILLPKRHSPELPLFETPMGVYEIARFVAGPWLRTLREASEEATAYQID